MAGWISIHRQLINHWLWTDKPFSQGQAWIDLIMMANHKVAKVPIGKDIVEIERGSFITSELKLMDRWGWSKSKVRRFLELLENDSMIIKKTDNKKTTLTICNYCDYQDNETTKEPLKDQKKTIKRPLKDTNNNDNNANNENNANKKDTMYDSIFEFYVNSDLIKHKSLTNDMIKAMDLAKKELNLDEEYFKRIIKRHKEKVEATRHNENPIKTRPLAELFGQKKYKSVSLICTDYLDEVWISSESYSKSTNTGKSGVSEIHGKDLSEMARRHNEEATRRRPTIEGDDPI